MPDLINSVHKFEQTTDGHHSNNHYFWRITYLSLYYVPESRNTMVIIPYRITFMIETWLPRQSTQGSKVAITFVYTKPMITLCHNSPNLSIDFTSRHVTTAIFHEGWGFVFLFKTTQQFFKIKLILKCLNSYFHIHLRNSEKVINFKNRSSVFRGSIRPPV